MSECVNWLFGRGLSIACNLSWSVPKEWQKLPRAGKIKRIKSTLRDEMDMPTVNSVVIKRFLGVLSAHTAPNWRSRFITTNWDYLLQREFQSLNLETRPPWMACSHVFHLNGTVEELVDNSNRSPFLLEEDSASQRCFTPEANIVYNQMLWDRVFVVVGMSFECDTDKFLLGALNRAEDDMPIGESVWVVVNSNQGALDKSCARIAQALPRATVKGVHTDFDSWIQYGLKAFRDFWPNCL